MASFTITSIISDGEQKVTKAVAGVSTVPAKAEEAFVQHKIEVVERIVEVEKIIEVPIDRIVEVVKEVFVDRVVEVEKRVEVQVEKIVEVIKEVPVEIEKLVPAPVQKVLITVHTIPKSMWMIFIIETLVIALLIHYLNNH